MHNIIDPRTGGGGPREIVVVEEVPLLGSGKTDYPSVRKLVG